MRPALSYLVCCYIIIHNFVYKIVYNTSLKMQGCMVVVPFQYCAQVPAVNVCASLTAALCSTNPKVTEMDDSVKHMI